MSSEHYEDMEYKEALAEWEKGETVELGPPKPRSKMALYSLRIEHDTLSELARIASENGEPVSAVARRLINEGLRLEKLNETDDFKSFEKESVSSFLSLLYARLVSERFAEEPFVVSPDAPRPYESIVYLVGGSRSSRAPLKITNGI